MASELPIHFCPSHPCPICNYRPVVTPCIMTYQQPPDSRAVFTENKGSRVGKLEQLFLEVKTFLRNSMFLVGAEKMRELVKEIENAANT